MDSSGREQLLGMDAFLKMYCKVLPIDLDAQLFTMD
jgi:hypothetical protein